MSKALLQFCVLFTIVSFIGCAGINPPTPEEILKHPLGTTSLKIGMTRDEVESLWGKPDEINTNVESKEEWSGTREEWVYRGSQAGAIVPVDADYLSKTKRLYFDGNNLTEIK